MMETGDSFFQLDGQQSPLVLEIAVGQEVAINLVNNGQATQEGVERGWHSPFDRPPGRSGRAVEP